NDKLSDTCCMTSLVHGGGAGVHFCYEAHPYQVLYPARHPRAALPAALRRAVYQPVGRTAGSPQTGPTRVLWRLYREHRVAPKRPLSYRAGPPLGARRATRCSGQVSTDPTPAPGSPPPQTCPSPRSSPTVATTYGTRVRVVVTRPIGTSSRIGRCMMW